MYGISITQFRILVMEELFPITQLTDDAAKLGKVFREIFECHYWLYSQLNILHCDISIGNFMYRKEGDVIYGVLNDFDLSRCINDSLSEPSYRQPTGTIPFVAMELLHHPEAATVHLYRHDVESFFYVFYYIITGYDKNALLFDPPLRWWFITEVEQIYFKKTADFACCVFHAPTPTFRAFQDSLYEMFIAIRKGYIIGHPTMTMGVPQELYDNETMGGNISYDKFSRIFKEVASL
ncbi:hypothetical protein BDQ17DRAFT_1336182 [Cyathus striatus]|nr:hypothetical protein BDQ17DRAFT_1336182 [Cyathus striatus]